MNVELLRKLRDLIASKPADQVGMGDVWCGTAGCALGHAAASKLVPGLGLTIVLGDSGSGIPPYGFLTWNGISEDYVSAGVYAFDLYYDVSLYLFRPVKTYERDGRTEQQVFLDRIDEVLAKT